MVSKHMLKSFQTTSLEKFFFFLHCDTKIEWNFIDIPGTALIFTVLQISVTIAVWISSVLRDQSCRRRTVGQANKTEKQSTAENSTNANGLVECKVR